MNKFNVVKTISLIVLFLFVTGCEKKEEKKSEIIADKQMPVVEILYMNHGPVQPVLKKMRSEFAQFENKVEFKWYDFEKDIEFKSKKGIDYHTPLVVWINNSNIVDIDGEKVTFSGFPKDDGPEFARGQWNISQLVKAVQKVVKGN